MVLPFIYEGEDSGVEWEIAGWAVAGELTGARYRRYVHERE